MTAPGIAGDDGWGQAVLTTIEHVEGDDPTGTLLQYLAAPVSSAVPSKTWRRTCEALLSDASTRRLVRHLVDAIADAPTAIGVIENQFGQTGPVVVGFTNADAARGSIWAARLIDAAWVPDALASAFARASQRNDEFFAGSKVPNVCISMLAELATPTAINHLWRFETTEDKRGFHNQLVKALHNAAATAGVSVSQLIETATPTHGLDPGGRREVPVDEFVAAIILDAQARASLTWKQPDGRTRRTIPAALKVNKAKKVEGLNTEVRAINHTIAAEGGRLEQLISQDRAWSIEAWAPRYAGHPITAKLADRMLWDIEYPDGSTHTGLITSTNPFKLRTASGLETIPKAIRSDVTIRPWHPIRHSADDVRAVRELITSRRIRQPFKQAFREVYPLTPAERDTAVYSNRFAAHVLRYSQFYALLRARRWWSDYLDTYNDGGQNGQAWKDFPDASVQARFYFQAADPNAARVELCVTDQVRFVAIGDRTHTPVPLTEVPAVVLSEAMRDVDLFVSVSSVANDPTWEDRGTDRVRTYWHQTAFGTLETSAETRRDALQRLLPALKIADRCHIEDRWLVVRGDLRTYRIHLGSANIQMEPNDQYLCIVANRDTRLGKIYLPFDDDPVLTMILSKATLVADDRSITDQTILRQINP